MERLYVKCSKSTSCPKLHVHLSSYELKINCCLFERLFKVKKKRVFLFGISPFVLEIFMFLYYANEKSDDLIGGSTKTGQHTIENISRDIKQKCTSQRERMTAIIQLP